MMSHKSVFAVSGCLLLFIAFHAIEAKAAVKPQKVAVGCTSKVCGENAKSSPDEGDALGAECECDKSKQLDGVHVTGENGFDCRFRCDEVQSVIAGCDSAKHFECILVKKPKKKKASPTCACMAGFESDGKGGCKVKDVCAACQYTCEKHSHCVMNHTVGAIEQYNCECDKGFIRSLVVDEGCIPDTASNQEKIADISRMLEMNEMDSNATHGSKSDSYGFSLEGYDDYLGGEHTFIELAPGEGELILDYCVGFEPKPECDRNAVKRATNRLAIGYQCACNEGFEGNGFMCFKPCSGNYSAQQIENANCLNLHPNIRTGLECHYVLDADGVPTDQKSCMCQAGFRRAELGGGEFTCEDINECAECTTTCLRHTSCQNGNPFDDECKDVYKCHCRHGTQGQGQLYSTCVDINQCTEYEGEEEACPAHSRCLDSNGKIELSWWPYYRCFCQKGFRATWTDATVNAFPGNNMFIGFGGNDTTTCLPSCSKDALNVTGGDASNEITFTNTISTTVHVGVGTVATLKCPTGFVSQPGKATCVDGGESGGEWDKALGCVPACPPIVLPNGKTNCSDLWTPEDGVCESECHEPHITEHKYATCVMSVHGIIAWINPPVCINPCPELQVHDGVAVTVNHSLSEVTCNADTTLSCDGTNVTETSLQCVDGVWHDNKIKYLYDLVHLYCHPHCPPVSIENMVSSATSDVCGAKTTLSCPPPYLLSYTSCPHATNATAICKNEHEAAESYWKFRECASPPECKMGCEQNIVIISSKTIIYADPGPYSPEGGTVTVTCEDGYILEGSKTGTCGGGNWCYAEKEPSCTRYCPVDFASPERATITLTPPTSFITHEGNQIAKDGAVMSFVCVAGCTLVGHPSTTCVNGTWTNELGHCQEVCDNSELVIPHGHIVNMTNTTGYTVVGISVELKCDEDYIMTEKRYAYCKSGGWVYINEHGHECPNVFCYASCPKEHVENAVNTYTHEYESRIKIQGTHSVECVSGYIFVGTTDIRHCVSLNTYDTELESLKCVKGCPPIRVVNGAPIYPQTAGYNHNHPSVSLYAVGTLAKPACHNGYVPSEIDEATCQADGTWTVPELVCVKECLPFVLSNGVVTIESSVVTSVTQIITGNVIKIVCQESYALQSKTIVDVNTNKAITMEYITAKCTAAGVGLSAYNITNAVSIAAGYTFTWSVTYKVSDIVCMPTCQPPVIANGVSTPSVEVIQDQCYDIVCDVGYQIQGSAHVCCAGLNIFNVHLPTCIPGCIPLPAPDNGNITFTPPTTAEMVPIGTVAEIHCAAHHMLVPTHSVYCVGNNEWDRELGKCEPYCDVSEVHPENGEVDECIPGGKVPVGTTVKIHCNEGYYATSGGEQTCIGPGQWDEPVECLKVIDNCTPGVCYAHIAENMTYHEAEAQCALLSVNGRPGVLPVFHNFADFFAVIVHYRKVFENEEWSADFWVHKDQQNALFYEDVLLPSGPGMSVMPPFGTPVDSTKRRRKRHPNHPGDDDSTHTTPGPGGSGGSGECVYLCTKSANFVEHRCDEAVAFALCAFPCANGHTIKSLCDSYSSSYQAIYHPTPIHDKKKKK